MEAMKADHKRKLELKAKGHGEYTELAGTDATKQFFYGCEGVETPRVPLLPRVDVALQGGGQAP